MTEAEKAIEKLKIDYDNKISDCDKLIKNSRKILGRLRRGEFETTEDDHFLIKKEHAVTQAQRQAYVQAKCDIDSIIDHL